MTSTIPVTLVGATGLTGSFALQHLLSSPSSLAITTLTRKPLPSTPQNPSSTYVNKHFPDLKDAVSGTVGTRGGVFVSCLGTTRAAAGGVEKQREVDLVLNRELAKKAKADGVDTMILVSSGGADAKSSNAYMQMKGQLEEDVKEMDFKRCVILRPGLLLGDRTESRPAEWAARKVFGGLRSVGFSVLDRFGTDASDVGACIAYFAVNPPEEKVITLDNTQVIATAKKYLASVQALTAGKA